MIGTAVGCCDVYAYVYVNKDFFTYGVELIINKTITLPTFAFVHRRKNNFSCFVPTFDSNNLEFRCSGVIFVLPVLRRRKRTIPTLENPSTVCPGRAEPLHARRLPAQITTVRYVESLVREGWRRYATI
jgi:hypothetical protein